MGQEESAEYWEYVTLRAEQVHGRAEYTLTFRAKGMPKATTVFLGGHQLDRVISSTLELLLKETMADHVEQVIHHIQEPF